MPEPKKKPSTNRNRIRTLRKATPSAEKAGTQKKTGPARRRSASPAPTRRRASTAKTTKPSRNTKSKNPRTKGKNSHGAKTRGPRRGAPTPKKPKKITSSKHIPDPGENLRVIPLGGTEEIGKNMTAIEYKDDIIIIDAGFQFAEVETPGIDHIIPNTTYLKERKDKVRAMFITHGHMDHIGAIPYVMKDIGNPPIYSREFGALTIKKRQTEYKTAPPLDMRVVEGDEKIRIGENITVQFFTITHAIPDSMGLIITTPVGEIAFIEDVRVDHVDGVPTEEEVKHYEYFKDRDILLFTLDSTNIERPGFSLPESAVFTNIEPYIKNAPGRLIIGMFASQVERLMKFIEIADKYNKKVVVDGRSMKNNLAIVKELGLRKFTNIILPEEIKDHAPNKIVIIATGAQGEQYSVFDRIGNKTHKYIRLERSDTILFSASVVPGNEMSVQKLKDNLFRQEARVITYRDAEVHSSGHGNRGELSWIHSQINYKYFMPLHGHHYMLRMHAEMATDRGVPKENTIVPDNGSIIEFTPEQELIVRKEKVPADPIMVDGFSISGHHEVVLRDRQLLAEDGIVVIVANLDPRTGKMRKSPDIIARGFVYVRESGHLLDETRAIVKRTIEKNTKGMRPINFDYIRTAVTDNVRKHLFQRTRKSPMVIPVVIGI